MKRKLNLFLIVCTLLTLACACPASAFLPKRAKATPTPLPVATPIKGDTPTEAVQGGSDAAFGEMVFCQDFDRDSGEALDPSYTFPAGSMTVIVIFNYEGMTDGQPWSLQMQRGARKIDAITNEAWEDGESGWVAYELSEDLSNNPLAGEYSVRLSIGDQVVQESAFTVETVEIIRNSFPAFGPLTFAPEITDEAAPIQPTNVYEYGTAKVYAVFPYSGMQPEQPFRREWLLNGEITAEKEMGWDDNNEGITYAVLNGDPQLDAGEYTFNLYLDGQIARSAKFTILAPPEPEATATPTDEPAPDVTELVDGDMMEVWNYLATFNRESVRWLAEVIVNDRIKVAIDPNYNGLMSFAYTCTDEPPKRAGDVGEIKVSRSFYNEASTVELAGALAHETTHALQRKRGMKCGCTIEKEYEAYSVQGGFWVLAGAQDLVTEYVGNDIWDSSGRFDKGRFWNAIKAIYTNCPDY